MNPNFNNNWQRWIEASVYKYFTDLANTASIPIFVEGFPRDTSVLKDWLELRMDGPYYFPGAKGQWRANIEVNMLVSSALDQKQTYRQATNLGIMCAAFAATIPIFKLGDGPDDDPSVLLACFMLRHDFKEGLIVNKFGQIKPEAELLRAVIEGHYRADLVA